MAMIKIQLMNVDIIKYYIIWSNLLANQWLAYTETNYQIGGSK